MSDTEKYQMVCVSFKIDKEYIENEDIINQMRKHADKMSEGRIFVKQEIGYDYADFVSNVATINFYYKKS